jgi:uncharacterized protein YbjT (DUF2867 family)
MKILLTGADGFLGTNITRELLLKTLTSIRGHQRVTSADPEATYEALQKYGRDLVEEARSGKLDPVVGRDGEIRRVVRILSRKTKNNPVLIGEPASPDPEIGWWVGGQAGGTWCCVAEPGWVVGLVRWLSCS